MLLVFGVIPTIPTSYSSISQNYKKHNMHEIKLKRHNKTDMILLFDFFLLELINYNNQLNGQTVLTSLSCNMPLISSVFESIIEPL